MDFKSFFSAIPQAAQSPLALVAYLAAVGAWAYIAARVKRNKNLLTNLSKLPAKDRLSALREEMGSIPVPADLSPNDWLKARIHRYYFWAFALLCALLVLIVAMASYTGAAKADSIESSAKVISQASQAIVSASDPYAPEVRALQDIELGVQREFVISKLGVPRHEKKFKTVTCSTYQKHSYDIYLVYDNETSTVQFYSVASKDETFHPNVNEWSFVKPVCIGCQTFTEANEGSPAYFNYSAKIWLYVESVPIRTSSETKTGFLIDRGGYADYGNLNVIGDSGPNLTDVLYKAASGDDPAKSKEILGADETKVLESFRSKSKFNSYAWLADYQIKDEDEREEFELERGGHSTCPDQVVWE